MGLMTSPCSTFGIELPFSGILMLVKGHLALGFGIG